MICSDFEVRCHMFHEDTVVIIAKDFRDALYIVLNEYGIYNRQNSFSTGQRYSICGVDMI